MCEIYRERGDALPFNSPTYPPRLLTNPSIKSIEKANISTLAYLRRNYDFKYHSYLSRLDQD